MGSTHHPDAIAVEARPPSVDPKRERELNGVMLVTAQKQELRVEFAVETLTNLRMGVTACLRIEPAVTHVKSGKLLPARAFALLSDEDLYAIDMAAARYVGLYLNAPPVKGQPPMVVPASFRTLGSRKGRSGLLEAIAAPAQRIKDALIVELVEVGKGTPPGRLTEVAGMMFAVSRGVFARVTPGREAVPPERGSRLQAMTLDVGELRGDARITTEMLAFAEQMRGSTPALMVQGLPNDGLYAMATVAGLSHAGVRAEAIAKRMAA